MLSMTPTRTAVDDGALRKRTVFFDRLKRIFDPEIDLQRHRAFCAERERGGSELAQKQKKAAARLAARR